MILRELQRHAVDTIKSHALTIALGSPRAQAAILTEYLWTEEGAESTALHRVTSAAPGWVDKLVTRQLADERRHAELLRGRLSELAVDTIPPAPAVTRAKLWWIERACAPYAGAFAAGPAVVLLAVAAQFEATGVRVFRRHLAVLDAQERLSGLRGLSGQGGARGPSGKPDPTAVMLRSILADETRHAKSCAAAVERLVRDDERPRLATLRARVAKIDRAFGITVAVGFWVMITAHVLRDRRAHGRPS